MRHESPASQDVRAFVLSDFSAFRFEEVAAPQARKKSMTSGLSSCSLPWKKCPAPASTCRRGFPAAAPRPRQALLRAAPRRPRRPAPASSRSRDAPRCRARSAPRAARRPRVSPGSASARRAAPRTRRTRTRLTTAPRRENAGGLRPRRRPGRRLRRGRCRKCPRSRPTPRKLKRNVGAPHSIMERAMTCVTLLSMVPPNSGCGWQATPNTRGAPSAPSGNSSLASSGPTGPAIVRTSARVTAPCRRCRPS